MSGVGCIQEGHTGSPEEIREWMSGNICRCGAYIKIVSAVAQRGAEHVTAMYPFTFTKAADERVGARRGRVRRPLHRRRHHAGRPDARDRRTPRGASSTSTPCPTATSTCSPRGCGSARWCGCPSWPPIPVCAGSSRSSSQALELSASAQLRNMATIGGNLMQRPRCLYFRDVTADCNRRSPGSGLCGASAAATAPTPSSAPATQCVATHPSDLAVALVALDATVHHPGQRRGTPDSDRRLLPPAGQHPDQEHNLGRAS